MDSIFALTGKDCVLMVSDCTIARSVFTMKHEHNEKHKILGPRQVMTLEGDTADCSTFGEYIKRNIQLQTFKFGEGRSTKAVAWFTRGELATAIRKAPKSCNVLLGGLDEEKGEMIPSLYTLDYMGSVAQVPFAASGYCQYFLYSIFDAHWKEDAGSNDLVTIATKCIGELRRRFIIQQHKFDCKLITKDGIEDVSDNVSKAYDGLNVKFDR
eukprot:UN23407